MADQYSSDWDDDDLEDAQDSTPIKELRKANRAKEKQLREMQQQLAEMRKAVRERSVKDVLEARGLNPKIAKFIPEDVVDADAVSAWVEENAEVFGGAVVNDADAGQAEAQSQISPEVAALNRISQMQQSGQPFSSDPDQIAGRILSAQSPAELNEILFGSANGPSAY